MIIYVSLKCCNNCLNLDQGIESPHYNAESHVSYFEQVWTVHQCFAQRENNCSMLKFTTFVIITF